MISVIIPTYNRSKYIERAIKSVLNQTYKDFELIIVDDNNPGSEARRELEKKMKKYRNNSKIHYVQHERNKNGAAARNTGIKFAKGEYISFLDDDDFYVSNRLESLYYALEKNHDYDAAYSDSLIINKNMIKSIVKAEKSGNISKDILLKKMTIGTGSNLFFRSKALKSIGGFDETFKRNQDIEVLVRFCQKYKILNVNRILVVKDVSNEINEPKSVEQIIKIKENYINSFKSFVEQFSVKEKNQFYYVHFLEVLYFVIKTGEFNEYKKVEKEVKKYGKLDLKVKLKLLRYMIDKYLKISKLKEKIDNRINIKKIDENLLQEIKDMREIKEN